MKDDINKILEKIDEIAKSIPNSVEQEVFGLSVEELNTLPGLNDKHEFDRTLADRKKVISDGYKIIKMLAVYYQGWELDCWSFIVEKDGVRYKAVSSHGQYSYEPI